MGAARLTLAALLCSTAGCGEAPRSFILAAATSLSDSGLLDTLVSRYARERPDTRVRVVVLASGRALDRGRRGGADVLLVHAPAAEDRFLRDMTGAERIPVMYNDLLIVGPPDDPAGIAGVREPGRALARIQRAGSLFLSRGDGSGTHERELALWRDAGLRPGGRGYREADEGEGATLRAASQRRAYALTDRATFAALEPALDLEPLVQGHASLANLYSVILPGGSPGAEAAVDFADWLTSARGRGAITGFRHDGAGFPLFASLLVGWSLPFPGGAGHDEMSEDSASDGVTRPVP